MDRLKGEERKSPADNRSVLSISLSKPPEKDKNVSFGDIPDNKENKVIVIDSITYLKINNTYQVSLYENITH